jgi:hypothetical protein
VRTVARWRRQGYDFDLIDSHFFFPDGIAAVMLAGISQARDHHGARHRSQSDAALIACRGP